jgi:L-seryl-tRNA(Ser) seleniumtransferase
MLSLSLEELEQRARAMERSLKEALPPDVHISILDGGSQVGSGSVPVETIPTKLLSIKSASPTPDALGKALRFHKPPIFSRISKDAVLLDFRTIQPDEDEIVANAIRRILSS